MPLRDYDDLNSIQVDMLSEISNIGTGNAATSLAGMLQRPINIDVPQISILDYSLVAEKLGGPEKAMIGMILSLKDDINGMMMFLLKEEFAHMILNSLLGQSFSDFSEVDEMSLSAMQEIGNIMAASYVNAISQISGMKIDISPPDICIDMVGSLLSVPAIHFANISSKAIYIENQFTGTGCDESSTLLLMPDVDSLSRLIERLGLDI